MGIGGVNLDMDIMMMSEEIDTIQKHRKKKHQKKPKKSYVLDILKSLKPDYLTNIGTKEEVLDNRYNGVSSGKSQYIYYGCNLTDNKKNQLFGNTKLNDLLDNIRITFQFSHDVYSIYEISTYALVEFKFKGDITKQFELGKTDFWDDIDSFLKYEVSFDDVHEIQLSSDIGTINLDSDCEMGKRPNNIDRENTEMIEEFIKDVVDDLGKVFIEIENELNKQLTLSKSKKSLESKIPEIKDCLCDLMDLSKDNYSIKVINGNLVCEFKFKGIDKKHTKSKKMFVSFDDTMLKIHEYLVEAVSRIRDIDPDLLVGTNFGHAESIITLSLFIGIKDEEIDDVELPPQIDDAEDIDDWIHDNEDDGDDINPHHPDDEDHGYGYDDDARDMWGYRPGLRY